MQQRYAVDRLPADPALQKAFSNAVLNAVVDSQPHAEPSIPITWSDVAMCLETAAVATLGYSKRSGKKRSDPEIKILSLQQKQLRLQLENTENVQRRAKLKAERNRIQSF